MKRPPHVRTYLDEADVLGTLSEALAAHVHVVLSNDARGVGCKEQQQREQRGKDERERGRGEQKETLKGREEKRKDDRLLTADSASAGALGSKASLGVRVQECFAGHCGGCCVLLREDKNTIREERGEERKG
jgi:hypothetical protein